MILNAFNVTCIYYFYMYVQQNLLKISMKLRPSTIYGQSVSLLKDVTPIIRWIWLVKMLVIEIL